MRPGDARTVRMPVEGEDSPLRRHFVCRVERSRLRPGVEPRLGQRIRLDRQEGMSLMATVTEVTDTHVTLDANALPAGRNLLFDITLISAAPPRRGRPAAALWRHPGTGTYHSLQ